MSHRRNKALPPQAFWLRVFNFTIKTLNLGCTGISVRLYRFYIDDILLFNMALAKFQARHIYGNPLHFPVHLPGKDMLSLSKILIGLEL